METKPAFRSLAIVGANALARTSATGLNARLLLTPPCADVSRRRRVSILLTELRCHRPSRAPVSPLRFNSFARPRSVAKPAAISFRMVASKARARESAVLLLAAPARIPRLRDEVLPRRSIEPSWLGCATATDVKSVSRPARAAGLGTWCAQHALSIQLAISPDDDGHNKDHQDDSRT